MLPPANTDLLARELSGLLDGSACLQIKLPALRPEEPGHGLALSRWRGLGI
ncbi:hypothetical protein [Prochlorococcus sp. MIT 1312]|uniref:hypothetical protein n=1 Tax=Prochlorococcus sp. MIT 1312 TaxID=3082537 RepID=UPI0039AEB6CD